MTVLSRVSVNCSDIFLRLTLIVQMLLRQTADHFWYVAQNWLMCSNMSIDGALMSNQQWSCSGVQPVTRLVYSSDIDPITQLARGRPIKVHHGYIWYIEIVFHNISKLCGVKVLSRNIKVASSSPAVSNVLCPWARHFTSIVSLYPGLNGELLGIWPACRAAVVVRLHHGISYG